MSKYKIKLSNDELLKKVRETKTLYLIYQIEKNPLTTFGVIEYLFGKEETEKIIDEYKTVGDLNDFLMDIVSTANSQQPDDTPSLPGDSLQDDTESSGGKK